MISKFFIDRPVFEALAACCPEDGSEVGEGVTHVGREAIRRWRERVASRVTFVLEADPAGTRLTVTEEPVPLATAGFGA